MSIFHPRCRRALGPAVTVLAVALLGGCADRPSVISESQDKVLIAHGYPFPFKEVGELAVDRCAHYGRAPAFESSAPYDNRTAVANFRCVPVR